MELHIRLEGRKGLADQLYQQLRDGIDSGHLAAGSQLPPTRLLAEQLGVSRKTVAEAYSRLTYDNLLSGVVGRGTFVTRHPLRSNRSTTLPWPAPPPSSAGSNAPPCSANASCRRHRAMTSSGCFEQGTVPLRPVAQLPELRTAPQPAPPRAPIPGPGLAGTARSHCPPHRLLARGALQRSRPAGVQRRPAGAGPDRPGAGRTGLPGGHGRSWLPA